MAAISRLGSVFFAATVLAAMALVHSDPNSVLGQKSDRPSKEGRDKDRDGGDKGGANKEEKKSDDGKREKNDDETRPIRFTFPTAIPGVELGRAALERAISNDDLDGKDVVRALFQDFELIGWANVIRTKLAPTEFQALDRELTDANLEAILKSNGSSRTDRALAAALDKAKLSTHDFERGMKKVFDKWRGNETAAYFARQGYAESWMASRLADKDVIPARQKQIEDLRDREVENPAKLIEGDLGPKNYRGLMELWLGLPGRPDKREIEYIFREEKKVLNPDILRVLSFDDAASAVQVLENAGIKYQAFQDQLLGCWKELKRANEADAKKLGGLVVDNFEQRLQSSHDWLNTTATSVKAVYSGNVALNRSMPVLGSLEGDGKDAAKLPDLGISESLSKYFSSRGSFTLVLHTNNSVRAMDGSTRYEGKFDPATGKLDMVAVYGGRDLKFEGIKFHGGGLLFELSVAEAPAETAKRLLKRTRAW